MIVECSRQGLGGVIPVYLSIIRRSKDQDLVRVRTKSIKGIKADIIENPPKLTYLDYEMATVGASVAGTF